MSVVVMEKSAVKRIVKNTAILNSTSAWKDNMQCIFEDAESVVLEKAGEQAYNHYASSSPCLLTGLSYKVRDNSYPFATGKAVGGGLSP